MSDHGGVFAASWIMSGIWPYGNLAAWMDHDIFVRLPAVGLAASTGCNHSYLDYDCSTFPEIKFPSKKEPPSGTSDS
jgi:hypothetical protein